MELQGNLERGEKQQNSRKTEVIPVAILNQLIPSAWARNSVFLLSHAKLFHGGGLYSLQQKVVTLADF